MSRPKLRPLSDLLPTKGAASRPEAVSTSTSPAPEAHEPENKIGSEHTDTTKSPQANEQAFMLQSEQANKHARMEEGQQALLRSNIQARELVTSQAADFQVGPRSAVSFRMTERLQERLREYAHQTRRTKQDILDEALHEFLRRNDY